MIRKPYKKKAGVPEFWCLGTGSLEYTSTAAKEGECRDLDRSQSRHRKVDTLTPRHQNYFTQQTVNTKQGRKRENLVTSNRIKDSQNPFEYRHFNQQSR